LGKSADKDNARSHRSIDDLRCCGFHSADRNGAWEEKYTEDKQIRSGKSVLEDGA